MRHKTPLDIIDATLNELHAEQAEAEAKRLVEIGNRQIVESSGEKLVLSDDASLSLADTLENPNMISAVASRNRLQLARKAGVLPGAIDAAMTIDANDSLRKSLAHQLAAAHQAAMTMFQMASSVGFGQADQATRCIGAATRAMTAFQNGMLALQKLKTGHRQTVVVKHVQVQQVKVEGGQAVVTGSAGDASQKGSRK